MTARRCTGTTRKGEPCKASPRHDTGTCNAHAPKEVQESSGFGGSQEGAGRPRTPRVVDVIRERIEQEMEPVIGALVDGLTAERGVVIGGGENAYVEFIKDHDIRIKAARELLDRAYGRPVQALEHAGAGGGPIETSARLDLSGLSVEERDRLEELLERATDAGPEPQ